MLHTLLHLQSHKNAMQSQINFVIFGHSLFTFLHAFLKQLKLLVQGKQVILFRQRAFNML